MRTGNTMSNGSDEEVNDGFDSAGDESVLEVS